MFPATNTTLYLLRLHGVPDPASHPNADNTNVLHTAEAVLNRASARKAGGRDPLGAEYSPLRDRTSDWGAPDNLKIKAYVGLAKQAFLLPMEP